jgi:hypothetical protein
MEHIAEAGALQETAISTSVELARHAVLAAGNVEVLAVD